MASKRPVGMTEPRNQGSPRQRTSKTFEPRMLDMAILPLPVDAGKEVVGEERKSVYEEETKFQMWV